MINGVAHGPEAAITACQLHMRFFKDGDEITIEPWRATAFPVIKDLMVDRGAFDRIIQAGSAVREPSGTGKAVVGGAGRSWTSRSGRVDVWVEHPRSLKWPCPECDEPLACRDHARERSWRHLDSCQFQTYLHARIPRVECPVHGVRQTAGTVGPGAFAVYRADGRLDYQRVVAVRHGAGSVSLARPELG